MYVCASGSGRGRSMLARSKMGPVVGRSSSSWSYAVHVVVHALGRALDGLTTW